MPIASENYMYMNEGMYSLIWIFTNILSTEDFSKE